MTPGGADLDQVRSIVLKALAGREAQVFLFGSWTRGDARRHSDIDVAILPAQPLPPGLLLDLRERLDNSLVPYPVDLVDLSEASPSLRERVLTEGVRWTD